MEISNNDKVYYTFSKDEGVAAFLLKDGEYIKFKKEDIPEIFKHIKTADALMLFLKNAWAKISSYSTITTMRQALEDSEKGQKSIEYNCYSDPSKPSYKLQMFQKLLGGMRSSDPVKHRQNLDQYMRDVDQCQRQVQWNREHNRPSWLDPALPALPVFVPQITATQSILTPYSLPSYQLPSAATAPSFPGCIAPASTILQGAERGVAFGAASGTAYCAITGTLTPACVAMSAVGGAVRGAGYAAISPCLPTIGNALGNALPSIPGITAPKKINSGTVFRIVSE